MISQRTAFWPVFDPSTSSVLSRNGISISANPAAVTSQVIWDSEIQALAYRAINGGDPEWGPSLIRKGKGIAAGEYTDVPAYGGSGTGLTLSFVYELQRGFTGGNAYAADNGGQIEYVYFVSTTNEDWVNKIPDTLVVRFGDVPGGPQPVRQLNVDYTLEPGTGGNEGNLILQLIEPYTGPNLWTYYAEWQIFTDDPQELNTFSRSGGTGYRYGDVITVALPRANDVVAPQMPVWVIQHDA